MKFYKRFPGDIQIKTGGLSMAEFGAYDRLLDHYYAMEAPIEANEVYSITRAQGKADREAVDKVLRRYFTVNVDGNYEQERADEMIAEAQPKIAAAKANGKLGGRPIGSAKKPNGLIEVTQGGTQGGTEAIELAKGSQNQNQKEKENSEAIASGGSPPKPKVSDPAEIIFGYGVPMLTVAGSTDKHARSFLAGLRKEHGDDRLVNALRECIKAKPLQPLEWLAAALPPKTAGKHAGFASKNYREGIEADGSLV